MDLFPIKRPRKAAPKPKVPSYFGFYETIDDLLNNKTAFFKQLETTSPDALISADKRDETQLIQQARRTWHVVANDYELAFFEPGDIIQQSFLKAAQKIETRGQIRSIGYLFTTHRFSTPAVFKPSAAEIFHAINASNIESKTPVVAFDIMSTRNLFAGKANTEEPNLPPHVKMIPVAGQRAHITFVQLFTGHLPPELALRPIKCNGKTYTAELDLFAKAYVKPKVPVSKKLPLEEVRETLADIQYQRSKEESPQP